MSKYTTQLRYPLEAGNALFDFDYPIFDENYRGVLEQKIIDTYYFREIGLETWGQFKHYLKVKLNNIMPYYNQLYESEKLFADYKKEQSPFFNANTTETHTKTTSTDANTTANTSGSGTNDTTTSGSETFSDTPQGKLEGLDYATNLTDNEGTENETFSNSSDSTSSGNSTTTEDYTIKLQGDDGMRYPASVLMELRESFLNIDKRIIDELNDLFMNIY